MNRGIERNYEGSNHLEDYKLNVTAENDAWVYKIPQRAIDDDRTYNLSVEDKTFPAELFQIGQDFGGWDWSSDGVVAMTPVHSHTGAFWTTRYLTAGNGFKFCSKREWNGDFFSLDNNYGFTMEDGNCYVEEDGFYTIYVDLANSVIAVEPAAVYGMGDCFGGWGIDVEENKFVAEGTTLVSPATVSEGNIRMYAAAPSVIEGVDWWQMEFNVYDGIIVYRGAGSDQEPVSVPEGYQVALDLNAGIGSIAEPGVEQAYL
ncbi:MAG: SusF/SusE family outer membrane protein, partial [Bacteroidaceae bacterium]|nr:SusF/SusE family outer membrane protein [Bacteroidaceae bacterium]